MNSEPPPIADPHSTAPVLSATEPNIWTATIVPIALWLLGVPLVLLGLVLAIITPAAADDYGWDSATVVENVTFSVVMALIGLVLIYVGSRLYKSRKSPPS